MFFYLFNFSIFIFYLGKIIAYDKHSACRLEACRKADSRLEYVLWADALKMCNSQTIFAYWNDLN